jgi:rfaE bifunctional protein nucleotidyltransferase chain/domain
VKYLEDARELGTHLIVALNSDASTRKIKGEQRPFIPLQQRMEVLAALRCISYVTWFEEETPAEVIRKVSPDVLVKGGDWKPENIVGKDFVEARGGQVCSIPFLPGWSTTKIVKRILTIPESNQES